METMRFPRNMLAYLLAFLLLILLYVPVLIVTGLCRQEQFPFTLSRHLFVILGMILGIRTRVRGLGGIDFSQPMVLVCNHLSNLDGPLLFSALPCYPRALIKNEARKIPLVGRMLKLAGFVFVDRKNPPQRQEALAAAVEKIKKKRYSFLVFPEGTRSKDGSVRDFKKGGFKMALEAGVAVLPVRISGSRQLLPPGRMIIRPGVVDIELFSPISLAGLAENDLAGVAADLQKKIYQDKKK